MTMRIRRLLGVQLCLLSAMGAVTVQADWACMGQTPSFAAKSKGLGSKVHGADRQVRVVAQMTSDTQAIGDGLVKIDEKTYLVTAWSRPSWLVRPDGSVTALLDTNQLKPASGKRINNADSGFVPGRNLWVIPTFMDHHLLADELKTDGN